MYLGNRLLRWLVIFFYFIINYAGKQNQFVLYYIMRTCFFTHHMHLFAIVNWVACSSLMGYLVHRYIVSISVRQGILPEIPEGITEEGFRGMLRRWIRQDTANGYEGLRHRVYNRKWSPEEKLELVQKVLSGNSNESVATKAGMNPGQLHQWVCRYKIFGYNGLVDKKKGRKPKEGSEMKRSTDPKPLSESEREELIRLRAENEYIKAENEVIKKEIALREERWAAQLKAKKQQSSKSSGKKDIS